MAHAPGHIHLYTFTHPKCMIYDGVDVLQANSSRKAGRRRIFFYFFFFLITFFVFIFYVTALCSLFCRRAAAQWLWSLHANGFFFQVSELSRFARRSVCGMRRGAQKKTCKRIHFADHENDHDK